MDLDALLKKSESLHALAAEDPGNKRARRARPEDDGTAYFPTIANALYNIWHQLHAKKDVAARVDVARVEVEVRVGHVVLEHVRRWKARSARKTVVLVPDSGARGDMQLTFKAGVDEIYAEHLRRVLAPDKFAVEQRPVQRLRCDAGGTRWEVDGHGHAIASSSSGSGGGGGGGGGSGGLGG